MKSLARRMNRGARALGKAVWALADQAHPVLVHIIPMRRCHSYYVYCDEYDAVPRQVPREVMLRRHDKLTDLGTPMITVSSDEPLVHPELDAMNAHTRRRGMIASLITNGYYLHR